MITARPILVTGSHRSGTTWTGKMIAQSPEVVYLQEPFNLSYYNPGLCGAQFVTSFRYITADNEANYLPHFRKTAAFSYNWRGGLSRVKGPGTFWHVLQEGYKFGRHQGTGHRPLFKDPFAVLSAEWMAERLNTAVVVLIRHPAAFVSSVKRFNWITPLYQLLEQPLLMRDLLEPCRADLEEYSKDKYGVIAKAAAFWKFVYFVVDGYRQRHADWLFVRHEDLSRAPVEGFRQIFEFVDLPYTANIIQTIQEYSDKKNPKQAEGDTSVALLNSRANIYNWKERLTTEEIDQVRLITEDVAQLFYTDEEW
jgi:hypothetical protein